MRRRITAIELFSGIGAFAVAAREAGIDVIEAFDQSQDANAVYALNFGRSPCSRNLDSIRACDIPPAQVWWMSPPCKPFTTRGTRRDDADARAASFVNLIGRIGECAPGCVLVENVRGFAGSRVHQRLLETLARSGYCIREIELCPTRLGVPMRRPRHYVYASRSGLLRAMTPPQHVPIAPLARFLDPEPDPALTLDDSTLARHGRTFNVVDPDDPHAVLIPLTWGYPRNARGGGSVLRMPGGKVRRLSPEEILRLLGFPADHRFPDGQSREVRWRLAGNSVDVRAIRLLIEVVNAPPE